MNLGGNLCKNCEMRPIENQDTRLCATCGHLFRKSERESRKVKVVKPIRKVSSKMAKDLQDYGVLRRKFIAENPECQVRLPGICDGMTTDVHHSAKRGAQLLNKETFIGACRSCHIHIEQVMSAEERRDKGLLRTVDSTV